MTQANTTTGPSDKTTAGPLEQHGRSIPEFPVKTQGQSQSTTSFRAQPRRSHDTKRCKVPTSASRRF